MKEEKYTCYHCKKEWDLKYDPSAYTLEHISLTDRPIMGDNRINGRIYFCGKCFNSLLAPILKSHETQN